MPMSDTLGSLPTGVSALVLDFAETYALMFLREVSLPLKRLAETWFERNVSHFWKKLIGSCCGSFFVKLFQLFFGGGPRNPGPTFVCKPFCPGWSRQVPATLNWSWKTMKCSFFSNHSQKTNQRHIARAQCFGTMSYLISDFQWSMLVHFLRLLVRNPSLKSQPTHRLRRAVASQGDAWKIFFDKLITWSKWPQFQAVLVFQKNWEMPRLSMSTEKCLKMIGCLGKKRFKPENDQF